MKMVDFPASYVRLTGVYPISTAGNCGRPGRDGAAADTLAEVSTLLLEVVGKDGVFPGWLEVLRSFNIRNKLAKTGAPEAFLAETQIFGWKGGHVGLWCLVFSW